MVVIDTSVWLDLFLEDKERKEKAEKLMDIVRDIYEPGVFKIELAGTLARRFKKEDVLNFVNEVLTNVTLIPNPEELTFQVALNTGCRAIDAYFIATAELTDLILVTNDKMMAKNAKKYGIEAYYLIEEFDKVLERIKELQQL